MTAIKKLIDGSGNQYFPQTHTKAVVDDYGNSVKSVLDMQTQLINQAQMETGAVPSDIYPMEGSTNWVTSGGVYEATKDINVPQENLQNDTLTSSMAGNLARESDNTFHTTSNRVVILSNLIPEGCTKVSVSSVFTFSVYFANIDSSIVTPYNGQSVVGYKNDTGYLSAQRVTCNVPDDSNRVCIQLKTSSISNAVSKTTLTFHIDDGFVNKADVIMGMLETKSLVDTSGYVEYSYWINDAATRWASSSEAHCKIIPVHNDTEYELQVPSGKIVRYAFLKTNAIQAGSYPSFCDNYYGQANIHEDVRIKTPSDCNYLYCLTTTNGYFVIPTIYSIGLGVRDFDSTPTQSSDNAVTSGGVYEAINTISYYGVKQVNVLSSITSDMWARTTWKGTTFATSNTGATFLLPNDISNVVVGSINVKVNTSRFAFGTILLEDPNAEKLSNNISVIALRSNSDYQNAGTDLIRNYPSTTRNRAYIQIESSTGTAAGDIALLQKVIMSVTSSDTPVNAKVLGEIDSLDLSSINPYNSQTYPYYGEPINLRQFTCQMVGAGLGTQGSCCYNGVIFGFSSNSLTVKIYDMNTKVLKTATMESGDGGSPSNSHNNAAFFTDEFYDASDPFPLIGTSDDVNRIARIFRIGVNNGTYSLTLVQKITFAKGETAQVAGNTYTYGEGKIWAMASPNSGQSGQKWCLYDFDMPSLSQGDVTLTNSSANEHVLVNQYDYQGMCYYGGKLYMPQKVSASDIIVFDPETDTVVTTLPIASAVSKEIEDTWIYKNRLYFTSNDGIAYVVYTY